MTAREQTPAGNARILVADDDHLVRAGIVGILATADDIDVVAQASDGHEAIDLMRAHRPDVVLLDIQMPRLDGIAALQIMRELRPELPAAMLTTFSDDHLIADALSAGALGFLLKSDEPEHLIGSVRALAAGGGAFSPRVARWLAGREHTAHTREAERRRLHEELTERQIELLTFVGRGLSNAQIGASMNLSEGTIKQYLTQLFTVLGIDNRVHAAVLAHKSGLLS